MPALPPIVFEHFRAPRNQRALEAPSAVGRVEGRKENSQVRLYLRVDAQERVEASFELSGDRTGLAALSLLTAFATGRTLSELRTLSVETTAAAYDLPPALHPLLLPAHEALSAALADLDGCPSPCADDGELVCTCLHVRRGRILRLARERNLRSLAEVRRWTRACSGCRSCRDEVLELIEEAHA